MQSLLRDLSWRTALEWGLQAQYRWIFFKRASMSASCTRVCNFGASLNGVVITGDFRYHVLENSDLLLLWNCSALSEDDRVFCHRW